MNIRNYCFPPEEYRKLLTTNVKLDLGEELEMELRFKKMTRFQFERIYDWLGTLAYPSATTEDVCTSYTNPQGSIGDASYRRIESPSYQYGCLCQKKRRVKWVDLEYFHIKQRLSISIEQVVPNIPPSHLHTVSVIRRRTRTTFDIGNEKIMMTRVIVESKDPKQEMYEMEIELSRPEFSKKIQSILPTILYHLFPHHLLKKPKSTIRPKNLLREEVPNLIRESYTVTNKMDGVRFLLYIVPVSSGGSCIIAQNNQEFMFISSNQVDLTSIKSLLTIDAEYFNDSFHIFDCSHHNPNHSARLDYIRSLNLPSNFLIKSFTKNILMGTHALLKQKEEDNDGLIFTSKDGKTIKKWKYPHKHSIDFRLKKGPDAKLGFGLYVFDSNRYEEVLFHQSYILPSDEPLGETIIDGSIYECGLKTQPTGSRKPCFYIMRHRPDRRYSNKLEVAEKNLEDMHRPFDPTELCNLLAASSTASPTTSRAYRSFHNAVKRDLITRFCKEKIIVDIGSGKGGDLHKFMHTDPKFIFFIEPNTDYCNEFNRRAVESGFDRSKYELVPRAFEYLEVSEQLHVDVVSSFFSFTFFCYTPELMENVIYKISSMLNSPSVNLESTSEGGYFIGTVMDGHRTIQFLNEQPDRTFHIPGTSGYIKRTEHSLVCEEATTNNPTSIDYIEISLPDSNTVPIQIESIVYMDQLESCCNKYGLVLRECTSFSDRYLSSAQVNSTCQVGLSKGQIDRSSTQEELDLMKIMNRLYTTFVFQKN